MTRDISSKPASGSRKAREPDQAGAPARDAQAWGGGSMASNGPATAAERRNEQGDAKG